MRYEPIIDIANMRTLSHFIQQKTCSYGDKCYRTKNKEHMEEFVHDADNDDGDLKQQIKPKDEKKTVKVL